MDATDPQRPLPPDLPDLTVQDLTLNDLTLHDLTRQLHGRKANLLESAGREADLRWTVERLRRDVETAARREADLRAEAEAAAERVEAMRTVLDAYAASSGPFGLRRRRFVTLIRQAAQAVPDAGPRSARHAVLLAEARRLLARGRS